MSANRGTPFDPLFQALTEKMGVLHTASPDTDPTQRDRVEWRAKGVRPWVKRGYRRRNAAFAGFTAITYEASIYGATELELLSRVGDLVGWLDFLVGPFQGGPDANDPGAQPATVAMLPGDGYDIGKPSTAFAGGEGEAAGYGCTVPVTLYLPSYQQQFPLGTVTASAVAVSTTVLNTDGSVPAGDQLNPIEAT